MTSKLAVIGGPAANSEVDLLLSEFVIGRDASNELPLPEMLVSRQHAAITVDDGTYTIRDLESRNGTFVNGLPIRERRLAHGDRITIGSSILVFLDRDAGPVPAANPVEFEEYQTISDVALRLRPDDAILLRPGAALASQASAAKVAQAFETLVTIGLAISSIRDVETLAHRLLELVSEAVAAEHGAIVLTGRTDGNVTALFGWNRGAGVGTPVQVSRTVVQQVLSTGESTLSADVLSSNSLGDVESLRVSGIRSLLVVPILSSDRPLGVLYLGAIEHPRQFGEEHLQLLTAVARLAAPVFETAQQVEALRRENERLAEEIALDHKMVGESAAMRPLYELIAKVAPRDSTVLILGESGTGKELVARAVHENSSRSRGPFVAVNCATLTENLLESELFGHERGAFTGAIAQRRGKLELANGGTIFLDEIGELALQLQAKLLRVLQEREIERLGGTRPIPVDIRVVAATNRDLDEAIAAGTFRKDLYYRLNVVTAKVPPLRDRVGDVRLLASFFAAKYAERCKRRVLGISSEAGALLAAYDWPGNVRELENAIERAVVLGGSDYIVAEDLPEAIHEAAIPAPDSLGSGDDELLATSGDEPSAAASNYHTAVATFKARIVREAVEQAGGNLAEAARLLGVHRNYVSRLLKLSPTADGTISKE
jgi:Nif-specific regulatory protein